MPVLSGIIPSEILNNSTKIPLLGLGVSGLDKTPGVVEQAIKFGIDLGYRYIDVVGSANEAEVGKAIGEKMKEGVVKREELYLVGKLSDPKAYHNPALILEELLRTLRNLNVAYIDMYVLDCPEGGVHGSDEFVDTWNEMEKLVDKFLVKSIGLSHFNAEQIHHLLIGARVSPVTNQIECNPYCTQRALRDFCNRKHIAVTGRNVFGSEELLEDPLITHIAKKHKRTPEQILLRYQIDNGNIAVVEVDNKTALMSNLDAFKFELKKSDIAEMDNLDLHKHYI